MKIKNNGITEEYLSDSQFSTKLREDTINPDEWSDVVIPNELAEWRKNHHLSFQKISIELKKAGFFYPYQYIQKVEKGEVSPAIDFLYALKMVYGVSINDLFLKTVLPMDSDASEMKNHNRERN